MCHLILLLPVLGLSVFWLLPLSLSLPAYLVILLLSGWVYYYVIVAMKQRVIAGPETLLHSQGKVVNAAGGTLQVRVQSEQWSATSSDDLIIGETVEVVGINGLMLRVKKAE